MSDSSCSDHAGVDKKTQVEAFPSGGSETSREVSLSLCFRAGRLVNADEMVGQRSVELGDRDLGHVAMNTVAGQVDLARAPPDREPVVRTGVSCGVAGQAFRFIVRGVSF